MNRWMRRLGKAAIHGLIGGAVATVAVMALGDAEWSSPWGWLGVTLGVVHLCIVASECSAYAPIPLQWGAPRLDGHHDHTRSRWDWVMDIPSWLRTLALSALTVALFRPQTASTVENMTREGIDLIMTMDLSASMLSKDFKPNRLESAKEVATEFVDNRPFDRIGVVAYEGEAFTQVPLTTDHVVVKNGLSNLNTGMLQGGTAIGSGLAVAVNRLRESDGISKVIVLLTDGENNAGQIEPLDAAQLAQLNNIRVYTIGVGSIGKAKSPVAILPNGSYKYDWVDVRIDEDVLKGIAEQTGGRYFRATSEDKLKEIYREIDMLERTKFNVLRYQRKTEASAPWILMAVLALGLEFVLRTTVLQTLDA